MNGIAYPPRIVVHTFATTCEAYDASQIRDDIHDGDILLVENEGVIGILYGSWPCAITEARGAFHGFDGDWRTVDGGKYGKSFARALGEQSPRMRVRGLFALRGISYSCRYFS